MSGPAPRSTRGVQQSTCAPSDLPELYALWSETMPAEALEVARCGDLVARAGLAQIGLLRERERLIGFLVSARDTGTAWIMAYGVAEDRRGQGFGHALLENALSGFERDGCDDVRVGGPGEHYLLPGVDVDRYPVAARALTAFGFTPAGETQGMERDLTDRASGPRTPARHFRQAGDDVEIRRPTRSERQLVEKMIASRLSVSWSEHLHTDDNWDRVSVAFSGGQPVGFAGYDMFPGCPGRFGPTGVMPAFRGRGLGSSLLQHVLTAMRARGHQRAWFLWGPEGEAGMAMYRSAGFRVNRRFTFYVRPNTGQRNRGETDGH